MTANTTANKIRKQTSIVRGVDVGIAGRTQQPGVKRNPAKNYENRTNNNQQTHNNTQRNTGTQTINKQLASMKNKFTQ